MHRPTFSLLFVLVLFLFLFLFLKEPHPRKIILHELPSAKADGQREGNAARTDQDNKGGVHNEGGNTEM